MVHRVDGTFAEILTTRHICPQRFDLRLNGIHINVTHYDDRLIIRTIPFVIVIAQGLILKIIDHSRVTDHIAFGVLRTRVHQLVQLLPDTAVGRATGTPFLQNYTALSVDLFV